MVFVFATLAINTAVAYLLDEARPRLRDPEYARRISCLRQRVAENPNRPLVLVVGSSRTAMGIKPGEWEIGRTAKANDFLLFNLSLIGGGPVLELIVTERAIADGIKPAGLLLEYWPPLLNVDRDNTSLSMLDRLGTRERSVMQEHYADPDLASGSYECSRLNPIYASRHRLLSQLFPKWIPTGHRLDWMWNDIDEWGWKPGCDFKPGTSESRTILVNQAKGVFERLFADFQIDYQQERAIRETVSLAREKGIEVGFIYMPESSEFRGWYPPAVEQTARQHFARITQELGVVVIDARTWINDELFSDGFHLTRIGAAEFTLKLCPAIDAAFPSLKGYSIRH